MMSVSSTVNNEMDTDVDIQQSITVKVKIVGDMTGCSIN